MSVSRLSITALHPLSPLPPPPDITFSDFISEILPFRLNLLSTDGTHLFFTPSPNYVIIYHIVRNNGISLIPANTAAIHPPTVINNSRLVTQNGRWTLIMSGGSETEQARATIGVLSSGKDRVELIRFPLISAWGLDCSSDKIAFSCNSQRVAIVWQKGLVEGYIRIMEMDYVHEDNIPCVAFSKCERWLASGCIGGQLAIYDVSTGHVMYRSESDAWVDVVLQRIWGLAWVEMEGVEAGVVDIFRADKERGSRGGTLYDDSKQGDMRGVCEYWEEGERIIEWQDVEQVTHVQTGEVSICETKGGQEEPEDEERANANASYLVVGRQSRLELYRIGEEKVKMIDSLRLRRGGLRHQAVFDIRSIGKGGIVAAVKGFGVLILRIAGGKMVVEREFKRGVDVVGVCVAQDEIWMVWADGGVEAWQVDWGVVRIDAATVAV